MDQQQAPTDGTTGPATDEAAPAPDATSHAGDAADTDANDAPDAPDAPQDADATAAEEPSEPDDPEARAAADGRSPGELLLALEQAQAQRDEFLESLQRKQAEFENFRRRSARESQAARTAGAGDLVVRLLDALDDVDRTAEAAGGSADEALAGGVRAVQRKLAEVLVATGVERVDDTGVPFDANRHEAVQQVPADEPLDEPEVAEVFRPGYLLGERVLRPAMVVVRQ